MLDRADHDGDKSEFPAELLIWLSPAFPIGAFAYSQGLETAVARGWVSRRGNAHGLAVGSRHPRLTAQRSHHAVARTSRIG